MLDSPDWGSAMNLANSQMAYRDFVETGVAQFRGW